NVWVEKARTVAPLIEQYRDQSEKQRHLAKPVYEAIRELGLFKLWLPRSLRGEELDLRTGCEVIEALAKLDGGAAWNLGIALQSGWLLGFLEQDVAAEMLADDPDATLGGSGHPHGVATPVEGGYRVSGQWPFLSGSNHTRWLCANCRFRTEDGEGFQMSESGPPVMRFLFFRSDQYEVLDTWYSTGLRASGSNDIKVVDAFVPEGRQIDLFVKKSEYQTGPLYGTGLQQVLGPPLAFVALGVAAEAIDAFAELAIGKVPTFGSKRLIESDHIQMTLGKAMARLGSARSYLYEKIDLLWEAMLAGNGSDEAVAMELGAAAANAAESAVAAVELVWGAAGTSGVYEGNALERCARDVRMVTQHIGSAPSNYTKAGAYRLGLGVTMGR
ncbi:MAG: acyl-CoA dehydrogenase family protein, partial [Dehalococcoidia bacterium]